MSGVRQPIVPTFKTGQRAIRKNTLATSLLQIFFTVAIKYFSSQLTTVFSAQVPMLARFVVPAQLAVQFSIYLTTQPK